MPFRNSAARSQRRLRPRLKSPAPLAFVLRNSGLHNFFEKLGRQRVGGWEAYCAFRRRERLEFIAKLCYRSRTWEKAAMAGESGVTHQHTSVFERRNTIADSLGRFRRHDFPNNCANLPQGAASWFGNAFQVFVNRSRNLFCNARCLFLHRAASLVLHMLQNLARGVGPRPSC